MIIDGQINKYERVSKEEILCYANNVQNIISQNS